MNWETESPDFVTRATHDAMTCLSTDKVKHQVSPFKSRSCPQDRGIRLPKNMFLLGPIFGEQLLALGIFCDDL